MVEKFFVQGVAITPGLSRNGIFYKAEELKKFAKTMNGVPFLKDHKNETDNIHGVIEKGWWSNEDNVKFSGWTKDPEVISRIKDGRLRHVSVGATVGRLVEEEFEDGTKQMVAEDLHCVELSTIPVPGVPGASVSPSLKDSLNELEKLKEGKVKRVKPLLESFDYREDEFIEDDDVDHMNGDNPKDRGFDPNEEKLEVKEPAPEETENYIRIRRKDPADFVRFRVIDLDKAKGIRAVIGFKRDGGSEIQSYLFDKKKGWTKTKAVAWVKKHETEGYEDYEEMMQELEKEFEQQMFNCECIKCGFRMTTEEHCADLKCPKCGGQMRRVERPGPGREELVSEIVKKVPGGWAVFSHDGKKQLSRVYKDKKDAERRLREIEFFKKKGKKEELDVDEKIWTTKYINDLPDAAFALILPGGKKDEEGKTKPRSLRKLPHHNMSVKDGNDDESVDIPHLRNALARAPQMKVPAHLIKKAIAHLEKHAKNLLKTRKKENLRKIHINLKIKN